MAQDNILKEIIEKYGSSPKLGKLPTYILLRKGGDEANQANRRS